MHKSYLHYIKLLPLTVFAILLIILNSCNNSEIKNKTNIEPKIKLDRFNFAADSFKVVEEKVKKNKTLSDILLEQNVDFNLINKIFNYTKPVFDFRKIQPGKIFAIYFSKDSLRNLKVLVYEKNKIEYVKIDLRDSLNVELVRRKVTIREKIVSGSINSSLYQTFENLNVSPVLAGLLSEVFAWQIDFYTIIKGDSFNVLYQEKFVENEHVGFGNILGAEFIHKHNKFLAVLFEHEGKNEYYDEAGKSLQKEFLKAPLRYTRISSRYSYRRKHPILRVFRPHRGIDFAAPIGTPVQAVGDGIVTKKGRSGAAGKMVKIRHNSVYTSGYLHLSKYGKGIRVGTKVKQGQVIGYVGSTGRSTGPHLDFRFWKNGSLVNYLTQKFPSSKSVSSGRLDEFFDVKDKILEELNEI